MSSPGLGIPVETAFPPLPRIVRALPRTCFERSTAKSLWYVARDLAQVALLVAAIIYVDSWLWAIPLAVLMGFSLTGIFVLAHDCGHRSFSNSQRIGDVVGEILMPLTLWPYEVWRLSHDHHHRHTHHAKHDIAWTPLTPAEYERLSPLTRPFYRWTRTWLANWASVLFQYFMVQYAIVGGFFAAVDRPRLRRSVAICAVIVGVYIAASISLGWYGFVMLFLLPQLVFQFWMSTFTLLHHTRPEEAPMTEQEWNAGKAQLGSSIHMHFPRFVDWMTHDISWHVPHHVCVGVPHYHLRAAHAALKQSFSDLVLERKATWAYWRQVVSVCHLVEAKPDGGLRWVSFDELAQRGARLTATSANHT